MAKLLLADHCLGDRRFVKVFTSGNPQSLIEDVNRTLKNVFDLQTTFHSGRTWMSFVIPSKYIGIVDRGCIDIIDPQEKVDQEKFNNIIADALLYRYE